MKKIIIMSVLSLMSSVYAVETINTESKSDVVVEKTTQEPNNKSYLYEFDFAAVGKADKSVHKYMTNNPESVATTKALEETMKKNWNLSSDYSRNLKLKSESKLANNLICKYNNGLVVKVKSYGDYSPSCPLK